MASLRVVKIRSALLRRLIICAVILPPVVGVTGIWKSDDTHLRLFVAGKTIVIPGSQSYLDPNPSF